MPLCSLNELIGRVCVQHWALINEMIRCAHAAKIRRNGFSWIVIEAIVMRNNFMWYGNCWDILRLAGSAIASLHWAWNFFNFRFDSFSGGIDTAHLYLRMWLDTRHTGNCQLNVHSSLYAHFLLAVAAWNDRKILCPGVYFRIALLLADFDGFLLLLRVKFSVKLLRNRKCVLLVLDTVACRRQQHIQFYIIFHFLISIHSYAVVVFESSTFECNKYAHACMCAHAFQNNASHTIRIIIIFFY